MAKNPGGEPDPKQIQQCLKTAKTLGKSLETCGKEFASSKKEMSALMKDRKNLDNEGLLEAYDDVDGGRAWLVMENDDQISVLLAKPKNIEKWLKQNHAQLGKLKNALKVVVKTRDQASGKLKAYQKNNKAKIDSSNSLKKAVARFGAALKNLNAACDEANKLIDGVSQLESDKP